MKFLRFVMQPSPDRPLSELRRARVLGYTILALIVLLGLTLVEVLVFTTGPGNRRELYIILITILFGLLILAYLLNRTGYFNASAQLTVACAMVGPWVAVLLDRSILQGDYIPLVYTSLSLFLAAILLPVRQMIILSVIEVTALVSLSLFIPESARINWPSLLAFIFFTSILSIISTNLSQHDLQQIEKQNQQLSEREAQMRELSVRDPLTGLYNRRYLEDKLGAQILVAQKEHAPLSLVMIDIDHFKKFNDVSGHMKGDELLSLIGSLLRSSIRISDYACRYGGEEFLLILPGASLSVAYQRAERLRSEVSRCQADTKDKFPSIVTLSMGIASYPQHGQTPTSLLRAADEALYCAKDEGRDRVVAAR